MGLKASYFDILNGHKLDKIYIRETDEGLQEIYFTFESEALIRITCNELPEILFKKDKSTEPVILKR